MAQYGRSLLPSPPPSSSSTLAENLRERIFSGDLPESSPLPPERELTAQSGLGRSTVREALRVLEAQGLIAIRKGRGGGAFVRKPDAESTALSIGILLRGRRVRLDSLLATRETLEPTCARLAANHATEEDILALREHTENLAKYGPRQRDEYRAVYTRWHVTLAAASGNELFHAIIQALSTAIYDATGHPTASPERLQAGTIAAHRRIVDAVSAGDGDAAERRMKRHVRAYSESMLASHSPGRTPQAE